MPAGMTQIDSGRMLREERGHWLQQRLYGSVMLQSESSWSPWTWCVHKVPVSGEFDFDSINSSGLGCCLPLGAGHNRIASKKCLNAPYATVWWWDNVSDFPFALSFALDMLLSSSDSCHSLALPCAVRSFIPRIDFPIVFISYFLNPSLPLSLLRSILRLGQFLEHFLLDCFFVSSLLLFICQPAAQHWSLSIAAVRWFSLRLWHNHSHRTDS